MNETIAVALLLYLGLCAVLGLSCLVDGCSRREIRSIPGAALVFVAVVMLLVQFVR